MVNYCTVLYNIVQYCTEKVLIHMIHVVVYMRYCKVNPHFTVSVPFYYNTSYILHVSYDSTFLYNIVQYCTILYISAPYITVQYSIVQYTVLYCTIKYLVVLYNIPSLVLCEVYPYNGDRSVLKQIT